MKKWIVGLLLFPLSAMAASVSDMISTGNQAVNTINNVVSEMNQLVSETQNAGDPVLLQCVSTKQASVLALKDISESALVNLEAIDTTDKTAAEQKAAYELRKITLSQSKVQQFYNEAQRCTLGLSAGGADGGEDAQIILDDSNAQDAFGGDTSISGGESYSFDSSSTSSTAGAEGINPPPATSPF